MSFNDNFSDGTYKFAEIEVMRDFGMEYYKIYSRDFLVFYGDIGGLLAMLQQFGGLLLSYSQLVGFLVNSYLISKMFYHK